MTDLRSSLEHARSILPVPDLRLERVLRRRERLERRRRIKAGVLATAIAIAAIVLAVRALGFETDAIPAGPPGNGSIVVYGDDGLVVIEPDGQRLPLVDNPVVAEGCPAEATCTIDPTFEWSPDGTLLAFVARSTRGPERIYTVEPDGSGLRLLVTCDGRCTDIAWSPDGHRLGFAASNTIAVINVDTDEQTDIRLAPCIGPCGISPPSPVELTWSPDGSRIASLSDHHTITVSAADGSSASMLVQPRAGDPEPQELTWGSDASVVFSMVRTSSAQRVGIWFIDLQTGARVNLVDVGPWLDIQGVLVAPDGSLVWAQAGGACPNPGCPFVGSIWTADADGLHPHMLYDAGCCTTPNTNDAFTGPVLSPDGTQLVFTVVYGRDRVGEGGVYVMNLDGTGIQRIATTGVEPAWQPIPEEAS